MLQKYRKIIFNAMLAVFLVELVDCRNKKKETGKKTIYIRVIKSLVHFVQQMSTA